MADQNVDPVAQHADLFDELVDERKSYLDYQAQQGTKPPKPSKPVAAPVPQDTVTYNNIKYKKAHLDERGYVKPEFRHLYQTSGFIYGSGLPGKTLGEDVGQHFSNMLQKMAAPGMGLIDFGVDAVTSVANRLGINAESINRQWDNISRFDSKGAQQIRKFASVALPSAIGAGRIGSALQATKLPFMAKFAAGAAGVAATDAAIISVSDEGLEQNSILGSAAENFPSFFGPSGIMPLPAWTQHQDDESPAKTKLINMLDQAGASIVGDVLGLGLRYVKPGVKGVLSWFSPNDAVARSYKARQAVRADADTVTRIAEIEQALATKPSSANAKVLNEERERLIAQLQETGYSDATTKSAAEQYLEFTENSRRAQIDEEAILKLEADPQIYGKYVPEITPGLASPGELARQTFLPGNAARNMADTAAIKMGATLGDPAPILSGPMLKRGLVLGQSRNAVAGLAEAARRAGDFDATVDGFRMTSKQMRNAHSQIYADIIRAGDVEEVKRLFADDRNVATLIDGTKVKYLSDPQNLQAELAIRDLVDMYLGRNIMETSARVMDTLGREINTIAQAQKEFADLVDDDRVQEVILDKLEFLMQEHGLNKYISGWQLQNKGWFDRLTKSNNPGELTELINEEFTQAVNAKHASVKRFVGELKRLGQENPEMVKPLFEAFSQSNGDVDTLHKLYKWAEVQMSPTGMLMSADPRSMNLFARTLWGVGMNNVLSMTSFLNAIKGNLSKTIFQPIEGIIGHGIEAIISRDIEPIKRAMYYYGGVHETQKRALSDAIRRIKTVHHDYDFMMSQIRDDYRVDTDKEWELLDAVAKQWDEDGDFGKTFQYKWLKANQAYSRMAWARSAMTGMSGVDAYTDTIQATQMSRLRAYDDVFSAAGEVTPELLAQAERKHYSTMFNADGVLTDTAAKNASGEVSLNLDDGVAGFINQAVTAVPAAKMFFMFPKTAANEIKQNLSYTPIAMIPGMNKYAKVLNAGDDIDLIKEALAEHGIKSFDATPNAMAIYQKLKNEYIGRVVMGTSSGILAYGYAAAGNIRGNGPVNASERQKLRDNYGWEPKTINIGGKWVSFKGIPMIDPILTLVGDLAYYQNDIGESVAENIIDKLGWTLAATFTNNTPLHGIEPLIAAMNGDEASWSRLTANMIRTFIPQSGNMGIVSNAITSSQKDIYKDMMGYVMNRLPIASSTLPEQVDFWTGKALKDIDNPFLRALNAASPIKVSEGAEPWRKWLLGTGYDGISRLTTSSEGGYQYDAETRERLGRLIGEQKLYKKIENMMTKQRFNDELDEVRALRRSGATYEEVKIKTEKLTVFRELDRIVSEAKQKAEARLFDERPEIREAIYGQKQTDILMGRGDVGAARESADLTDKRVQELRQLKNK